MPGASAATRRVEVVNANWAAGADGEPGRFALLLVTEDGERHVVEPALDAVPALLALVRDSPVLLWDPENRTLVAANLHGEWLPADFSALDRA